MSILNQAKAGAAESAAALKLVGGKAVDLANDAQAKARTSSLVDNISDAATNAKNYAAEAATDLADAAKKAGSALLDKAEERAGKDLNIDGKVGTKES
jgi:hypothetical protein